MRKTKEVTIVAEGRDKGKVYVLREMPSSQAEKWAVRAFLSLARSGVEVPDSVRDAGIVGLLTLGVQALAGVRFEDAEPLMDEMFRCITILPDPQRPTSERRLVEEDIEEIPTRIQLRKELWDLHTGFLPAVDQLAQAGSPATATGANTPNTPTSPSP